MFSLDISPFLVYLNKGSMAGAGYGRGDGRKREISWGDLEEYRRWDYQWFVIRDLNMVLRRHESCREIFSRVCVEELWRLYDRLNLMDLPLPGGKWTSKIIESISTSLGLIAF